MVKSTKRCKDYEYAKVNVPREFVKQVDIFMAFNGIKNRQKYLLDLARQIETERKKKENEKKAFIDFNW